MVMKKKEMTRLINSFYRGLCLDMKTDPKPTKWLIMWVAVVYVLVLVDEELTSGRIQRLHS